MATQPNDHESAPSSQAERFHYSAHAQQLIATGQLLPPTVSFSELDLPIDEPCQMPLSQALREQRTER